MKQNFLKVVGQILGVVVVASSASAYRVPFFAEVDTGMNMDSDARTITNTIYMNWTFKINDNWSVVPEFRNDVTYKKAGVKDTKLDHTYTRVLVTQRNIGEFAGFKVGIDYRYRLPTDAGAQEQGSYGSLLFRPHLSKEMGNFSIKGLNYFILYLQRDGVNTNIARVGGSTTPTANPVFGEVVELIPSYKFGDSGLSFTGDFVFTGILAANVDANRGASKWTRTYEHEYELDYQHEKYTANTMVGVSFYQSMNLSKGSKHNFTKAASTVNLKIAREF